MSHCAWASVVPEIWVSQQLQAGLCGLLHVLGACSHLSDCATMQAGAKGKGHCQQIRCCTRLCLYSGGDPP